MARLKLLQLCALGGYVFIASSFHLWHNGELKSFIKSDQNRPHLRPQKPTSIENKMTKKYFLGKNTFKIGAFQFAICIKCNRKFA